MADADFALALSLQEEFSALENEVTTIPGVKRKHPTSIVDDCWETIDPTPDIRDLFLQFNDMYFDGKLSCCEVKWAPRMTLCAGVCCYEGRGGLCSIKLSMPLLKLRPRKDLVQTLLHEMVHAYLFVTHNNKDHDAHGPEFHKHMHRINKLSGANITVYHNFHDEVDLYRQHWWRCDGPCQNRPPYYGMVRRAMNRAPSPRDPWWSDHQKSCGGTYHKVREPEDYGKKKQKKGSDTVDANTSGKDLKGMPKITDLWKKVDGKGSQPNSRDLSTKGKAKINNLWRVENEDSDSSASGKENNTQKVNGTFTPFSGQGHLLGSAKAENSTSSVSKWKNTGTVRGSTVSGKTSATQSKTGKIGSTFNLNGNKVDPSSKGKEFRTSFSVENIETKTSFRSRVNKIGASNLRTSNSETISTELHSSLISNRGTESSSNGLPKKDFSSNDTKSKDSTGTQLTIIDAFRNVGNEKAPFIVIDETPPRSDTSSVLPSLVQCPVCQAKVAQTKINAHLDVCL